MTAEILSDKVVQKKSKQASKSYFYLSFDIIPMNAFCIHPGLSLVNVADFLGPFNPWEINSVILKILALKYIPQFPLSN